jgi:hypothetical protein
MTKTLVCILCETRAHELTFDNFKKNVIDELNADLCLSIAVKPNYNYENPFYKLAKYKFLYDEPDDFGDAFDYAYNLLVKDYKHIDYNREEKHIHWRNFLKIKDQFMGGVKDNNNQHPGSAGILIFFRWFLYKNIIENDLHNIYDRFIITRSDYIYQLPHPKLTIMNPNNIWIPDEEGYGGYTDRHTVLSKNNLREYLNIFENFTYRSHEYFLKMSKYNRWNLERLIKLHLTLNNVDSLVKHFPYVMYTVRNIDGSTRWSTGNYNSNLGYYIKYDSEYNSANKYKDKFINSNLSIDDFYTKLIL